MYIFKYLIESNAERGDHEEEGRRELTGILLGEVRARSFHVARSVSIDEGCVGFVVLGQREAVRSFHQTWNKHYPVTYKLAQRNSARER